MVYSEHLPINAYLMKFVSRFYLEPIQLQTDCRVHFFHLTFEKPTAVQITPPIIANQALMGVSPLIARLI